MHLLNAIPDFLLHTVRGIPRMGQRVRELLMPQGPVALWTEYASGLFQQVLPTGKDKAMPAQLVKEVGKHSVVARPQRNKQFAIQKRTQDGCVNGFHKHASLIGTIGNEAQLVIVKAAAQRQGMVLHGGGGHGCTRFLPRRSFRRVVQVQQVFQGGVIGRTRFREPHKEVFPCEQDSSQDAEVLPVLVQSCRITSVGVVVAVQKICGKQFVQFSAVHNFGLVHGYRFPEQGVQVTLQYTACQMSIGTVRLSFF